MSYFIAHTISFSSDRTTFKCKGGDNNVSPRSNSWTKDIAIEHLFSELSGGSIQLTEGKQDHAIIMKAMRKHKAIFGGDWNNQTDFFHLHPTKFRTKEDLLLSKSNLSTSSFSESYKLEQSKFIEYLLENYNEIRSRIESTEKNFITDMFHDLDHKDKGKYTVSNGEYFIMNGTTKSRRVSTTRSRSLAKLYPYDIAETIAKKFHGFFIST